MLDFSVAFFFVNMCDATCRVFVLFLWKTLNWQNRKSTKNFAVMFVDKCNILAVFIFDAHESKRALDECVGTGFRAICN